MKKNLIIYILAGVIVLAGISTGAVILWKKNAEKQEETEKVESTTSVFDDDFENGEYPIIYEDPTNNEPLTNENGELIEFFTDAEGNTYEAVLETNANGELVTQNNGEKVTGATRPASTTKVNPESTTKKPGSNNNNGGNTGNSGNNGNGGNSNGPLSDGDKLGNNTVEVDKDGNANIVKPDGTIALSYSYDPVGKYFYTDDDPWQRNFGFNRIYDMGAIFTVMYLDTIHVYYEYGQYDWMVQFWKGQYGFLFVGSEIGLYYKEPNKSTEHYNCAKEDMEIMMQMTLYREGYGELFTRPYASHWWITAFVPGKLVKFADRSELTMIAKLTFKTEEECIIFCKALESRTDVDGNRFKEASSISKNRPETYKRSGATVDIVWRYLDDDRVTPTKPVTTTTPPSGNNSTTAPSTTVPVTTPPTTTKPVVTDPPVVE